MKFIVNGKNQALEVVAFESVSAEDFILREKNGAPKLVEGKATYRVPGLEVLEDGRRLHNVYVSLFTPQPIKRFTPYRFDGLTIVNVYSSTEGAIVTITAERLIPVTSESSAATSRTIERNN